MSILTPGSTLKDRVTLKTYRLPTDKEAYEICRWMSETISNIYRGYVWHVEINQDLVFIKCMDLNMQYGYRIKLSDIDDMGVALTRIGGEILERFNVRRGVASVDEVKGLTRNVVGDATPEL